MNNQILDIFDQKILDAVSRDGRITLTRLSQHVGLSKTPCQARLKRLETAGYIIGYRAILDPQKLGREHVAFVEVKLSNTTAKALNAFNRATRNIREIEQCHMIAGGFDYLLKVRTTDITEYRRILGEVISNLPHLAQSSTYVAMETVKENSPLE